MSNVIVQPIANKVLITDQGITVVSVGIQGPEGPKGDTGDTGLQGIQGIQGIQGLTGSQGPVGPQGPGSSPGGIDGDIQYNNSGSFDGITAVPIAHGGTGQTTASNAINVLLPSQTGQNGKALITSGTTTSWQTVSANPGGSSGQLQYNNSGSFAGAAGVIYASSGSNFTVIAQNATDVPLVVQGAPFQTANLQKWQDSSGTVLSCINSRGQFTANGIGTSVPFGGQFQIDLYGSGDMPDNSLNSGIRINSSYAGGSIPYPASIGWIWGVGAFLTPRGFTMYDSGGALLASGPSLGIGIGLNRGSPGIGVINAGGPSIRTEQGQVEVWTGVATGLGIVVKGAPSQAANLIEAQDSNSNPIWAVLNNGTMRPAHLADSVAANDSMYYSTNSNKLVYKDSSGVVNNLY